MVDGYPEIDERICDYIRNNWSDGLPDDSDAYRTFARGVRRIVVQSPAESDCQAVSQGLSVALNELGIPHTLVERGFFDDGNDLVPHWWVVITRGQPTILDGTAEQFSVAGIGDVGVVQRDESMADRYIR